jgi:hypothetical protein
MQQSEFKMELEALHSKGLSFLSESYLVRAGRRVLCCSEVVPQSLTSRVHALQVDKLMRREFI